MFLIEHRIQNCVLKLRQFSSLNTIINEAYLTKCFINVVLSDANELIRMTVKKQSCYKETLFLNMSEIYVRVVGHFNRKQGCRIAVVSNSLMPDLRVFCYVPLTLECLTTLLRGLFVLIDTFSSFHLLSCLWGKGLKEEYVPLPASP